MGDVSKIVTLHQIIMKDENDISDRSMERREQGLHEEHKQLKIINQIKIGISTVDIVVPFQKVIMHGLLVNRVVFNLLKCAFPKGMAGRGIPETIDRENVYSPGLQLIDMLITQVRGVRS